ncbi:MAG TPA: S41 family peptidase [Anaerolineales bacterium]|nr:S41 family peptidase [Anaerolineales bacterium]
MNKTVATMAGVFVAVILLAGAFSGGFIVGHLAPARGQLPMIDDLNPFNTAPTSEQQGATPGELQTLFVPFWEAWNIVHEQFVDQPVDDTVLMQGAIRGMMEALGDDYTYYMDPQVFESETLQLQGSYEGIGAYVDIEGDYLTIISPIQGSPADEAGLKPGDKVIAIDGEDMTGVAPEEARQKVLGPDGSEVTLTIAREGQQKPLEFVLTRSKIVIRSAEGRMLEDGIGYVDINTFGDNTTQELRQALDELMAQNPRGLIIDLRNNGGGYLSTSIEVSSEFIEDGVVLYEQFGDGKREEYAAMGNGRATEIPLVVLINEGSASASEILAGALQDYGRAKLVGMQSFGKGSVQIRQPLSNSGAARVTIAKWLTPDDRAIEDVGLTPDVIVEMTQEDFEAELDPQLDAAVETLLAVINNTALPTSMPTSIPAGTTTPVQE